MRCDSFALPGLGKLKKYRLLLIIAAGISIIAVMISCPERYISRTTPEMETETDYWMRVLLSNGVTEFKLSSESALIVSNPQTGKEKQLPGRDEAFHIALESGKFKIDGDFFVESSEVLLTTDEPHILAVNNSRYRGNILLIQNSEATAFSIINHLPLEPYLAGVISAEMPQYWEMEALKAQTIAARTYAMYIKNRFGPRRHFDVTRTQASQVYHGMRAETARTWQAVNRTKGKFLHYRSENEKPELFTAFYSSACGGHTENSEYVFGEHLPPLSGVPCPYCYEIAKTSVFYWPTVKFDKKYVSSALLQKYPSLKNLEQIVDIAVARKSDYGDFQRITSLKLTGINEKTHNIRAEDFRLTIDPTGSRIKSTAFKITDAGEKWAVTNGRGYGHAVGMCQCGAQAIARRGYTAEQILYYYYPGSEILKLY